MMTKAPAAEPAFAGNWNQTDRPQPGPSHPDDEESDNKPAFLVIL